MKSKILVLGGSGLVGSAFIDYTAIDYNIIFSYNTNKIDIKNTKSFHVDLLDNDNDIETIIQNYNPDVVLHTIAHPSVDLCETDHDIADKLHVHVTEKIVLACKKINAKLIFLSTDAVFEGQLNKKYSENDVPNPINYYGKTKLQAEKIVLSNTKNVVLRTSVIYGWHKKSRFTNWILDSLIENKSVDPFSDQYNTPTLVNDLVKAILLIIKNDVSGLFHATGKTCLNRYEFAILLAKKFSYDFSLIHAVTKLEKKQNAPRPISTCLDSSKLENKLNFSFSDISSGLDFLYQKSKTN